MKQPIYTMGIYTIDMAVSDHRTVSNQFNPILNIRF